VSHPSFLQFAYKLKRDIYRRINVEVDPNSKAHISETSIEKLTSKLILILGHISH
jgi:hypothetical protein